MSAIVSVKQSKSGMKNILYIDVDVKDEEDKLKTTSLKFYDENEIGIFIFNNEVYCKRLLSTKAKMK